VGNGEFRIMRIPPHQGFDPRVAYLIINIKIAEIAKYVDLKRHEDFEEFVTEQLKLYIEKNEMPADAIAPAILNLADDYMAGRPVTLRAGDYIALQNYLRENARA